MRVLAMLHLYAPHHCAGAEMGAHALLRALAVRGHRVNVLLSREHSAIRTSYTLDGVRVHPRQGKGDPLRWLSDPELRPHIIVTHLENTDRASILGELYRVPVVHLCHNTLDTTRHGLLRRPALVAANSQWMLDDLRDWWTDHEPDKPFPLSTVIHPPVAAQEYATTPGQSVTLVNMTAEKGSNTFYALADRFPSGRFLAVAGAYGDQDRRERPNVTWLDHVSGDRMRSAVYHRTRVILMPSVYESWGRVGIEAACSGIPTIAHPTPGLRESLGDAGHYADRDDIDAWAAHLRRLTKPGEWSAASAKASQRAAQLDPTADLDRWAKTLGAVAGGPASSRL